MTSKELKRAQTDPLEITVDEANDRLTIVMPLAPMDCVSESGKMDVLCTTNGWQKANFQCPRTNEQIQVNIFVGTRNGRKR